MSGFSFSKLKKAKPSMRRRLFLYMGALAALLLVTLFAVLLLLGQLKSPREELAKTLTFRMEAFQSDMESLWRNVSVIGTHLSEDMTAILEEQTADLSDLNGDADAVERLEDAMLEPLCQYVRQADCSGAFVMLNTSLVSNTESFSGLYVQRSNAAHTTSGLLLYRGMADIGRQHGVMPHRKWAQEFDLSEFPGFAEHLKTASVPIERDCRTTSLLTLPDTSERAILLTVPMLGEDGTVYGLCGFAVNQTYFSSHHVQPSGINRLACILSDSAEGLDVSKGLLTYPADGFCFVPDELLTKRNLREGLTAFTGTELSFVGLSQPFMAASGDIEPHALTVLIPKRDYGRLLLKSKLEIGGLLILLMFFGVVCCLFYTRRYFTPILEDIDHVTAAGGEAGNPFFEELLPLSDKLRVHERTITDLETERQDLRGQMEQAEANAKRLAQKRKGEIDPEEYHVFLSSYQKLGAESRAVIDAMVDGVSAQVLAEQLGKKMSTVYSYRRDIYGKVGIQGENKLQQLRVRVSLMRREQRMASLDNDSSAASAGKNAEDPANQ
ncbi:hypothetical protein [uncultured Dysosmobacter sp.]|uniref:hypothetical protein n=1 Tax=uncultured Dysosmobacter sp. TaxID=2591384 RepID=UPI002672ACF5|nr:hypothetical protein [uncultured Dysosmobacter sp.]